MNNLSVFQIILGLLAVFNLTFDYIKTIDIREKINGKRIIGWCVSND